MITSLSCFCVYKLDIKIFKYPVYRDGFFYFLNLILLYLFLFKNDFNRLYWYDSLAGIIIYFIYLLINIFHKNIALKFNLAQEQPVNFELEEFNVEIPANQNETSDNSSDSSNEEFNSVYNPFLKYKNFKTLNLSKKIILLFKFPIYLIPFVLILDYRRFNKGKIVFLLLTFFSSLALLGLCSYLLVWMMVIICDTFNISESIIGFTFIAAATSMEEIMTSLALCKREKKKRAENRDGSNRLNMVLSNCIGSNIFDMSIGLGLPYLLNSLISGSFYTNVYSRNISFIVFGLLVCLGFFLILINLFKWRLTLGLGLCIFLIWFLFNLFILSLEIIHNNFFKN